MVKLKKEVAFSLFSKAKCNFEVGTPDAIRTHGL